VRAIGLGILCVGLAACVPAGEDASAVAIETLARGTTHQPGCTARHDDRLIRNPADWAAFWGQAHAGSSPPLPAVDFSRDTVLATCGYRPSPGESSAIDAVRLADGAPARALVSVTDTELDGVFPAVITHGFHAVRVAGVLDAAEFVHVTAQGQSLRLETLAAGAYSGCEASADRLISTTAQWAAFWTELHAGQGPEPARPAVDFSAQSVLASCLGTRPSGGHAIRITGVHHAGGQLQVTARETAPGPGCAVTQALTQPYHVISVDRVAGGATFTRDTTVQGCP
jgi:hypothetical protein